MPMRRVRYNIYLCKYLWEISIQHSQLNTHATVGQRMTRTYVRLSGLCALHMRLDALRNALRLVREVQSPRNERMEQK